MDHEAIQDKLFALYDGELGGTDRLEVEVHLTRCSECRQVYTQWQHTAKTFFQVPQPHPSEAFVHQVMGRIDTLERSKHVARWSMPLHWLVPALGLASLLLLLIGPAQSPVSIEALLLADGRESSPTQFVLASEPPTTEQVFGFLVEGHP